MASRDFKPRDPNFRERVLKIWERANFIQDLGIELDSFEPGRIVTSLVLQPRHLQQNKFVHAGVMATMADHSAGGAGGTLIAPKEVILTVEYKINFLRPAVGDRLRCVAGVFQHGKTVIVAESDVFAGKGSREKHVARAIVTLAVVSAAYD